MSLLIRITRLTTMPSAVFFSSRSAIQVPVWQRVRHQHRTDLGPRLRERRDYKLRAAVQGQFGHPGKDLSASFFQSYCVWYWRPLSSPLPRFICRHFTSDLLITSVNRWRKYLHPHLLMWWKVSAQTQSTISPWQPSPTKALEPSPMKYPWRPSKPVCSHYYTFLLFSL